MIVGHFTEGGRRFVVKAALRLEPVQHAESRQTIEHEPIPDGALVVAITGETWIATKSGARDMRYADCYSGGQNVDDVRRIGSARAKRLVELWDRWHLNDMRANCAHMTEQRYVPGLACPKTGYLSGTAWLYEPVPAGVLDELRALFAEKGGQA